VSRPKIHYFLTDYRISNQTIIKSLYLLSLHHHVMYLKQSFYEEAGFYLNPPTLPNHYRVSVGDFRYHPKIYFPPYEWLQLTHICFYWLDSIFRLGPWGVASIACNKWWWRWMYNYLTSSIIHLLAPWGFEKRRNSSLDAFPRQMVLTLILWRSQNRWWLLTSFAQSFRRTSYWSFPTLPMLIRQASFYDLLTKLAGRFRLLDSFNW
jgi:hypothetical protein